MDKFWKVTRIMNYVIMCFFAVCSILLLAKVADMKVLPGKYFAIIVILFLTMPAINFLLRKKKAANIVFIIFFILVGTVFIVGYRMLDKVDKTIGKVTDGADEQITVMEIRVMAEDEANNMLEMKDYAIGFMKERDRKYADKVLKDIGGDQKGVKETKFDDDPALLARALYDGEVDAIIINRVYAAVFEETEEFKDFAEKTKVVGEVEIKEKIASRKEHENSQPESTTGESGSNNQGSSSGDGGGHDYGEYGEDGGGFVYKEPANPSEMSKSAFVVYISGIDTYGNVNAKSRSDVNILMAVNTNTKKVVLINTPRDYYVPLSVSNGIKDKLTHAGNFGVECSRDTLGMLYGVNAEYYIRMNFTGFIDVIDAMGGIDVYSQYNFTVGGKNFKEGMNYGLTGRQALAFARERHAFAAGDRQRGKNQMAIIASMIKKLATKDVVMNYREVLDAIAGSFQTNFTSEEIYALVHMQINDMASWSVESYSVDGTGAMLPTYSIPSMNLSVMVPDFSTVETAKEMVKNVLTGN